MSSNSGPVRNLPLNPSLEQLRKQAKELHRSYLANKSLAIAEVERFERSPSPAKFSLADAQRVLARSYGFKSWAELKHRVDGVNFAALISAAETGDIETVSRLAAARPELINPHLANFHDSPLHRAVLNRNAELVRTLMNLGADARTGIWPHRDATSVYAIAVDREYLEIIAVIEREENLRRTRLSHETSITNAAIDALLQAIHKGDATAAIAMLEQDEALIRVCDVQGVTALHLAAWKHDPAMVNWLLEHGASPNSLALCSDPVQRDPAIVGKSPLDFASIVAGWRINGCSAQLYFMENADVAPERFQETMRLLCQSGAKMTPRAAVALGDRETILQLHREGNLDNEVHLFRGGLLAIAVRMNRIDVLTTLLDLGIHPDESVSTDDDARSWGMPLWFASMCGMHATAELLLDHGADVNAIVYACGDALCMAVDKRMETLLYQRGAKTAVEQVSDLPTARSILNGTLEAYSLNVDTPSRSDLAEILLEGDEPGFVHLCLPHITRQCDDPFWTHVLLKVHKPEGLQLVLGRGVDPNTIDESGYSVLHHLASDYCQESSECRVLRAKILLDGGASLKIRDRLLQSTPLGWACRWGRVELVKLYLERGADSIEAEAERWATPLAWAKKYGHNKIIQMLEANRMAG